jgi:hypothetical protein
LNAVQALVRRTVLAWLACLLACATPARAQDAPTASGVKAAFLYKFLGYIEWPAALLPADDSSIVIGVNGADDVLAELGTMLVGRSVNQRGVQSRRVEGPEALPGVHMLYLGPQADLARSPVMAAARAARLLLVTDAADGLAQGGTINFVLMGQRVRFEVSLDAAERSSIKISSRVLSVAERVVGVRQ